MLVKKILHNICPSMMNFMMNLHKNCRVQSHAENRSTLHSTTKLILYNTPFKECLSHLLNSYNVFHILYLFLNKMFILIHRLFLSYFYRKPYITTVHYSILKRLLKNNHATRREIIYCKRAILSLSSSKIFTPPIPPPPDECVLI
jgi:hypothetical protein